MKNEYQSDLNDIRNGEPLIAGAAAKRIIMYDLPIDPSFIRGLVEIAVGNNEKPQSRVMAVYALGWADHNRISACRVREILLNHAEPEDLRDYAAEALGNMRDRDSMPVLEWYAADAATPAPVKYSADWAVDHINQRCAQAV